MEVNVYVEKVLICELEVALRTTSALWDREGKTEEKGKTNNLQTKAKALLFLYLILAKSVKWESVSQSLKVCPLIPPSSTSPALK